MFNKRERKLLAILLSIDEWLSGKTISQMLGVGNRTLQSDVLQINSILSKNIPNAKIISNNRLGYYLEGNRNKIRKFVASKGVSDNEESSNSINSIFTILLFEHDFISISKIADKAYLAPSSVSSTLDKIRKQLEHEKSIRLLVNPRKGFKLDAPEYVKRILSVRVMNDDISEVAKQYDEIVTAYQMIEEMKRILIKILVSADYIMEGRAFDSISRYCVFSMAREQSGFILDKGSRIHEVSSVCETICSEIKKKFRYSFSQIEKCCLDDRLNELNVIGTTKVEYHDIEEKIQSFCDIVRAESGMHVVFERHHLMLLSEHLHRMMKRIESENTMMFHDTDVIEKQYPVALHLLRTCFRKVFELDASPYEERMIVPYISSSIRKTRERININIVSDSPVGQVYRFREELYNVYGAYVSKIRIFPVYLYEKRFKNTDEDAIFLTTEENLVFENNELTYIDLYEERYQMDMILNKIKQKYEQIRKRLFAEYSHRLSKNTFVCKKKETDYLAVVKEYAGETNHLSQTIINEKTLLLIDHGSESHRCFRMNLDYPVEFKNRMIETILFFGIGRENMAEFFCEFIKTSINSYI